MNDYLELKEHLLKKNENRTEFIEEVLTLYTEEFFTSRQIELIKGFSGEQSETQLCILEEKYIRSPTAESNVKDNKKELLESLVLRYPVYMGKPLVRHYKNDVVNKILKYDPVDLADHDIRYCIVGKAFTKALAHPFQIIHSWGINLESPLTSDYATFVKDDKLDLENYSRVTQDIIKCIYETAIYRSKNDTDSSNPTIVLPLLGLGSFLKACPRADSPKAVEAFFNAVSNMHIYDNLTVKLAIFEPHYKNSVPDWLTSEKTKALLDSNRLQLCVGYEEGDMYHPTYYPNYNCFLVNAWDNKSFIGNGGCGDYTIDGFTVAGMGPGKKLANSSYLHNYFFSPHLLDSDQWVILK